MIDEILSEQEDKVTPTYLAEHKLPFCILAKEDTEFKKKGEPVIPQYKLAIVTNEGQGPAEKVLYLVKDASRRKIFDGGKLVYPEHWAFFAPDGQYLKLMNAPAQFRGSACPCQSSYPVTTPVAPQAVPVALPTDQEVTDILVQMGFDQPPPIAAEPPATEAEKAALYKIAAIMKASGVAWVPGCDPETASGKLVRMAIEEARSLWVGASVGLFKSPLQG